MAVTKKRSPMKRKAADKENVKAKATPKSRAKSASTKTKATKAKSTAAKSSGRAKAKSNGSGTRNERGAVLKALLKAEKATAVELGISPAYAILLEKEELLKRAGHQPTGKRGRPPVLWALTAKGKREAKKA